MPRVLTTNARIVCPHGGLGTTTPSQPFWKVNGGIVLVEGDAGVLSCPFVGTPCLGYTLRSMGLNATLMMGRKVILETDFNQSLTGLPLTMTDSHPLIDNSTPAPLPASGPAPPLPPQFLDLVKPVVTGQISAANFSLQSMSPAIVTASFSLASTFPRQWILTRILNQPPPDHEDLTNGRPPGATIDNPGGKWTAPNLSLTLTMNASYLASLAAGEHHLFMTGVSQRGLSNYVELILTVGQ
jgi:hypothetical protein